ncbi:hypothetical protein [Nocardia sp. NPDC048505]|uniref:hypothetical protein n=1 Tax=unclassified Nocardia TaxID=2637762 RepID=UPI0033E7D20C
MPQQQPVSQPEAPEQTPPQPALEAAYVCDSATAARLSRAAALLAWRLPLRWGILLVLPVFLLTRGLIQFLADGAEPREMFGAFFAVLGLELAGLGVLTVVRMTRPSGHIRAYSYPGARMSARYTPEAMELSLVTQPLTHRYTDIRKVIATDEVVYLHAAGTNGYVIPRALVPDAALPRLERFQH